MEFSLSPKAPMKFFENLVVWPECLIMECPHVLATARSEVLLSAKITLGRFGNFLGMLVRFISFALVEAMN